jgi:NADH-quinone oxidoreductase subunit G
MFDAAGQGRTGRIAGRRRQSRGKLGVEPRALKKTFVIVQDHLSHRDRCLADVVFPAASLYEKTGTVTNTFGDVQLVKKAADRAGVKPDFEILVRLAGAWAWM